MKSLVTVQNLYRRGVVFQDKELSVKNLEIQGIGQGVITLGGESFDMALADTLSRLTLLYDVPFSYLAPDDNMLPEESIRFFVLDAQWTKRLLDGALSIGRNTKYDYEHDTQLIDSIYRCAVKNNMQVRKNLAAQNRREEFEKCYQVISDEIETDTLYSGFLLRSSLVRHFEGLEVEGYGRVNSGEEERLLIARFDNLSPEVCLCLFCGELKRLLIKQPPEGIHLGFLPEGKKTLRSREDGTLYPEEIGSFPIWKNEDQRDQQDRENGILRYHNIAKEMKKTMTRLKTEQGEQWQPDSADMALQFIQNAITGEFTLKGGFDGTTRSDASGSD